jgi:hypothetical protein
MSSLEFRYLLVALGKVPDAHRMAVFEQRQMRLFSTGTLMASYLLRVPKIMNAAAVLS